MDEKNIVKNIVKIFDEKERRVLPKDQRVLHTQRCLIINHVKIINEFNNYVKQKAEKQEQKNKKQKQKGNSKSKEPQKKKQKRGGKAPKKSREELDEEDPEPVETNAVENRTSCRKRKTRSFDDFIMNDIED
jgi:hypothetical protein